MMILASLIFVLGASTGTPRVVEARAFGTMPDTGVDMGPQLRAAIADAQAGEKPVIVHLEQGEYQIASLPGAQYALEIKDTADLTLMGEGPATRLVFTNPAAGGIQFTKCERVRAANFAIDYAPLPFTQGTIVEAAADGASFILECDPGYLEPDAPCFVTANQGSGLVVGLASSGVEQFGPIPSIAASWSRAGDRRWRCVPATPKTALEAGIRTGARYVHMARTGSEAGFSVWECREFTLENVTVHAAPSLATLWGLNEDVTIRGLRVERPANSGRLLSTNADGIHCLGQRGALLIENCAFTAMADDSINIHARSGSPMEHPRPDQLLMAVNGCVRYRQGDRLQVYDPEEGRIRVENATVTGVEMNDKGILLTLDQPIPDTLKTGRTFLEGDHVFNLNACGAGAVIRGCLFGLHRGRGILLNTTDTRVEGNTFRNLEGWGVTLHQLQAWGEGPAAQRTLIKGNTFEGQGTGWASCIFIHPSRRDDAPALGMPIRGVRIEDNRMMNPHHGVLSAWAVDGLSFVNNIVVEEPGGAAGAVPLVSLHLGKGYVIHNLCVTGDNKAAPVIETNADVESGAAGLVCDGILVEPLGDRRVLDDKRPSR